MQKADFPEQAEKTVSPEKIPWYVHEEADRTTRLLGGLIIFAIAMVGLFLMEWLRGPKEAPIYLKEGIVHAIFGYITGWISGNSGGLKKMNMNGASKL